MAVPRPITCPSSPDGRQKRAGGRSPVSECGGGRISRAVVRRHAILVPTPTAERDQRMWHGFDPGVLRAHAAVREMMAISDQTPSKERLRVSIAPCRQLLA